MFRIRGTRIDRQRYLPKTSGIPVRSLSVNGKGPSLQTTLDYSVSAAGMKCFASKINARQIYHFAQYEPAGARERGSIAYVGLFLAFSRPLELMQRGFSIIQVLLSEDHLRLPDS